MPEGKILYNTKEEAEAETGYFNVYNIKISPIVSSKIRSYISRMDISTYIRRNMADTSWNTYTINWTLREYSKFSYISTPGHWGDYKKIKEIEETVGGQVDNCFEKGSLDYMLNSIKLSDISKVRSLKENTPDINKMYFWISKKYPDGVYSVKYGK